MPTLSVRIRCFSVLALFAAPLAQAQYYGQQPYNQQQYNRQQQYNPQGGDQTILYGTGRIRRRVW